MSWRLAPRPRRPGHQAMVQRRRQWYRAVGAAIATPGSDAGAAAHGTAAGFAKSWAALTLKCSCGSLVGLMLDASQGQKLILAISPPWCVMALAARIPVSQLLSRGKVPPLPVELTLGSAPAWSARCRTIPAEPVAPTTLPASCGAAATAGGIATAGPGGGRAAASSRTCSGQGKVKSRRTQTARSGESIWNARHASATTARRATCSP